LPAADEFVEMNELIENNDCDIGVALRRQRDLLLQQFEEADESPMSASSTQLTQLGEDGLPIKSATTRDDLASDVFRWRLDLRVIDDCLEKLDAGWPDDAVRARWAERCAANRIRQKQAFRDRLAATAQQRKPRSES